MGRAREERRKTWAVALCLHSSEQKAHCFLSTQLSLFWSSWGRAPAFSSLGYWEELVRHGSSPWHTQSGVCSSTQCHFWPPCRVGSLWGWQWGFAVLRGLQAPSAGQHPTWRMAQMGRWKLSSCVTGWLALPVDCATLPNSCNIISWSFP